MTAWTPVPPAGASWALNLVDRNILTEAGGRLLTESGLPLVCETQGNPSQAAWTPVPPATGFH